MTEPEATEAEELKEYHYNIGYIEHTAMLTPEMAERLKAKPIGEPLDEPKGTKNPQRGNVVSSRDIRGEERARRAQNKKT